MAVEIKAFQCEAGSCFSGRVHAGSRQSASAASAPGGGGSGSFRTRVLACVPTHSRWGRLNTRNGERSFSALFNKRSLLLGVETGSQGLPKTKRQRENSLFQLLCWIVCGFLFRH